MRPLQRQQAILKQLEKEERVFVDELTEMFETSGETIRRDLNVLAKKGLVRKFHGGASLPPILEKENGFTTRLSEAIDEKKRIAHYTVGLIEDGSSLFMDTGTTTLLLAQELAQAKKHLTVITSSTQIATEFSQYDHQVYLLGGEFHPESSQSLGLMATRQIKLFNAQYLISTIGTIDCNGAADFTLEEAELTKTMAEQAQQVIVVADHSKFNRSAMFQVLSFNQIDHLVTDEPLLTDIAEKVEQSSLNLHLAD